MQYRHLCAESIGGIQWRASQSRHIASPDACIASPDISASGVATSSLGVLLTTVRAAALVAAPAVAAAGPLSSSYLCLYATFTVLTCMDKFINLCALLVVDLWLWMDDIRLYLHLHITWLYKLPVMLILLYEICVMITLIYICIVKMIWVPYMR